MKLRETVTFTLLVLLGGCAAAPDSRQDGYDTFAEALSACRREQHVPPRRRFTLPPTHPQVSKCLARVGWNPDGTRR
jgi:hypothetical protein